MCPRLLRLLVASATCATACAAPVVRPAPVPPPVIVVTQAPAPSPIVMESPPPDPALAPLAEPTCVIHDAVKTEGWGAVALAFHGKAFALVDEADDLELRATDAAATLGVKTRELVLTGEVKVDEVAVRPRAGLPIDGWYTIRRASPKAVKGARMTIEVVLPFMVKTASPLTPEVACRELTTRGASEETFGAPPGKAATLKPGVKSPLRATPDGPVVATVDAPVLAKPRTKQEIAETPIEIVELQRKDRFVKIRIPSDTAVVEGWVERAIVGPAPGLAMTSLYGMGGLMGASPTHLECARDVPILVRDAGATVVVGAFRAKAPIRRLDPETKDEVPVDVGAHPIFEGLFDLAKKRESLVPFVRRASLEGCAEKQ